MKKLTAILIAIVTMVTMVACNDNSANTPNDEKKSTVNPQAEVPKHERAFGETPEEVAWIYANMSFKGIVTDIGLYMNPEKYEETVSRNADLESVLSGEKSFMDVTVEEIKTSYAQEGKSIADEEFLRDFYEKVYAGVDLSVYSSEDKGEDEYCVSFLVKNNLVKDYAPDFSVATYENSNIDELVEKATVESLYHHVMLVKIDGEWYFDSAMETGTLIDDGDISYTIVENE